MHTRLTVHNEKKYSVFFDGPQTRVHTHSPRREVVNAKLKAAIIATARAKIANAKKL